ncbi:hypothetical protein C8Q80DRAFT_1274380 [Daedaleopsis nitida]|nr:hypothetical protein C8Q80DRAFT_1274380 [Daedaleopsis nitida]
MPGLIHAPSAPDSMSPTDDQHSNEDLQFYRASTGIGDFSALGTHIAAFELEAFKLLPTPSVTNAFDLTLAHLSGYPEVLKLGRTRKNPILLDVGCKFGINVRKAILDGYPATSILASDANSELWNLGLKFFKTPISGSPISFLAGDIFSPYFLEAVYPFYSPPSSPAPALPTLTSLTPLHGQVSVVVACYVFHLLDEAHQLQLARAIAGLLSPEPGSMVIGVHYARPEECSRTDSTPRADGQSVKAFYHSPESWTELWDGGLFLKDTVRVDTTLKQADPGPDDIQGGEPDRTWVMEWTVTRL